jgi:hypothetical protein
MRLNGITRHHPAQSTGTALSIGEGSKAFTGDDIFGAAVVVTGRGRKIIVAR